MKKLFCLLLALTMALTLAACGQSAEPPAPAEASADTRTVTDVLGRQVEIPDQVDAIACLGSGAPRMAAYLNVCELLVGTERHDAETLTALRDYNPVWHETLKALPIVGNGGGSGENNGYAEELIAAAPDVILAGFSAEAADELSAQTGLPVVSVRYTSTGLANETFYTAMRVFAETVGAQVRCEEVLSYIDACKADLDSRTSAIPDSDKPAVYTGAVTFSGRHGFTGTYAHFGPLDAVNTPGVADVVDKPGYFETDHEQILAWDPDVIFLDPGNMNLVNDEYAAAPGAFDALRAVAEGQVYTMPSFNNCSMNISYALLDAYYAGLVLYPEQFSDVTMEDKAAEILTFFLGEDTYAAMAADGLYYGTITIGA